MALHLGWERVAGPGFDSMRPLTFDMLATGLSDTAIQAMPDWWRRIDSDPSWRAYSEYAFVPPEPEIDCQVSAIFRI